MLYHYCSKFSSFLEPTPIFPRKMRQVVRAMHLTLAPTFQAKIFSLCNKSDTNFQILPLMLPSKVPSSHFFLHNKNVPYPSPYPYFFDSFLIRAILKSFPFIRKLHRTFQYNLLYVQLLKCAKGIVPMIALVYQPINCVTISCTALI